MTMHSSEFRISIPTYHDNDDDDDDDELQRPTMMNDDHRAPTQKWLLPMVGIWNYYFDTTNTTNNNNINRTNDVDTMNINTRDYCSKKQCQRGSNHRNNCHGIRSICTTSSSWRRKAIYRPKRRLLLVPEQLYNILLMILLFGSFNMSVGFTIPNYNNHHHHHHHHRRYSQQISTRTITLDNMDDRTTPIETQNRNNPNNESAVTTNVHSNNAVSLLFKTTTTTMNHNNNKNQRTKSIHSRIRMIHHALRQTSRVTTAAVLAAVCTTTTTDIPPTITEETIPLPPEEEEHDPPSTTTTPKSIIKTTIDSVLLRSQQRQQQQRMNPNRNDDISFLQPPISSIPSLTTNIVFDPNTNDLLKTAAFSTTDHHSSTGSSRYQPLRMKPQMGIIINDDHAAITANSGSSTGSTISLTSQTGRSKQLHPDILIYEELIDPKKQQHTITKVRFATPQDDMDVAYLRMSVFADMNTNTVDLIRSQFCTRSCQAIASRRLRGAICFVATTTTTSTTTTTTTSVPQPQITISPYNNINIEEVDNDPIEIVVGSIECSYHEFFHTRLGSCRKQHALLYITEVAVHSSARRRGIGTKLLTAVDRYATQLRQQFMSDHDDDDNINNNSIIESLYLHVDVSNVAAIRMYEQCGYYKVLSNDPMYTEFTTGLNLHPGATRGREHYLMCKNLVTNPIWLSSQQNIGSAMSRNDTDRQHQQRHPILSRLGIEIPA